MKSCFAEKLDTTSNRPLTTRQKKQAISDKPNLTIYKQSSSKPRPKRDWGTKCIWDELSRDEMSRGQVMNHLRVIGDELSSQRNRG